MLTTLLRSCIASVFVCISLFSFGQAGLTYSSPGRIGTASLGETFSLNPGESFPSDVAFNLTGSRMYVIGNGSDNVYEFSLSTNYDVSTASILDTLSISGQEGGGTGIAFNSTGTQMYIVGTATDNVYQYNMTAFTQSTAVYSGNSFSVTTEDGTPSDIAFSNDGLTMFMLGNSTDNVYEYTLSVAYDITTASYSGSSFSVAAQETGPSGFTFNANGDRMFVTGSGGDRIYQYNLTTEFDITTAAFGGVYFSTSAQDTSPEGIVLNDDGTKLIMVGAQNDNAYGYNLSNAAFEETGANDGSVSGSLIMTLSGETFTSAGATLTQTTDYTITNLPTGLTPTITVSSDATSALLTLAGFATNNNNSNDVTLQFTFNNSAFTGGNAGLVANAIGASSGLSINFYDSLTPEIIHSAPVDVSTSIAGSTLNVGTEDTAPVGMEFSPDGQRMYLVGNTGNDITEYTLSLPYDISLASPTGATVDISFLDGTPTDVAFNANGTRMYVSGTDNDAIYEFILANEFDLSEVGYTGNSLFVGTQDTSPGDLGFNRDGSKLFMIGSTNDAVYEYNLSSNYDITTAVFSQSLAIGGQETTALAYEFNADGTRLIIVGSSSDRAFQYHLTTGFDLSTATYSGISYPITETTPEGLTLSADGTQMFIVGVSSDLVRTFDMTNIAFRETGANTGQVEGSMILNVVGETFINPGGTLLSGSNYSVDNLPSGLTPTLTVNGDGSAATLTLTGTAIGNENTEDVADIQVTFNTSAFAGGTTAASVVNAVSGLGGLAIDFNDNVSPEITYAAPVSVSTATDGATLGIGTEDTAPVGLVFSPDGMKMFAVGNTNNTIIEYSLSIGYDVTTAAPTGATYDMTVLDGTPTDVAFNTTGNRMFVCGTDTDGIFEFSLGTEFDLSTAAYTGNVFLTGTEDTGLGDLAFNRDGTKLFTIGSANDAIYEYNLATSYDITTAAFSQSFSIGGQEASGLAFEFNTDGTRLLVIGSSNDRVFEYHLSTGFDVSTASYSGKSYPVAENTPEGLTLSSDGTQFFVTGVSSDLVRTFDMTKSAFTERAANDGVVEGLLIIGLAGEVFSNAGGTMTSGSEYTVDNLPTGLTPTMTVNSDGLSATLTLSGTAISNDDLDDINDLQFTFANSAFTGGHAAISVINAVGGSSNLVIDFTDNLPAEVFHSAPGQVSTSIVGSTINIGAEDTAPVGLEFTPDGTKMYMVGNTGNNIVEYNLSVAYDVTTALASGAIYNMTVLDGTPTDVAFNANGSRMYVSGTDSDNIFEFQLATEYDLSTASYTGNFFYTGTEDTGLGDLAFNNNGTKLFTIGSANDSIYEYSLSVNYDITTAAYSQAFSIGAQEANGLAFEFNADGSRLFVVGSSNDRVFEYHLSTGFDVSTASYSGMSFPITEATPEGLTLSRDGTQLFITGVSSDLVRTFDMSADAFRETGANDGVVEGYMIMSLASEVFLNPGSNINSGTDYTVDNLPAGLIPLVLVAPDGLSATLTLVGNATSNDDLDDITDVQVTFTNAAFTGGTPASSVANAVGGSSNLGIDFTDNLVPQIHYTSHSNVSTSVLGANIGVGTEDTAPVGLAFRPDGLKMYLVGNTGNDIYEYDLSVAYDVSTAVHSGIIYDMTVLDGTPTDVTFNSNGSRMYVSGTDSDNIYAFHLETEYDLNTASYTGEFFNIATEDTSPGDLQFNQDGSKLFMVGSTNDAVYEYALSTNYDITTATFTQSYSVSAQETNPLAFEFNSNGSRLFIVGSSSDRIYEYHLPNGFDLSVVNYSGMSYPASEATPEGLAMNRDGTQLFVTGVSSDLIQTFDLTRSAFRETAANDGTVEGSMVIELQSEVFLNPGGSLFDGANYSVDNIPAGLVPSVSVAADGLSATLTFTGTAISNDNLDDITDIQMTFTDASFTGGTPASGVLNAVAGSSGLEIDFTDNLSPRVTYSMPVTVSTASYNVAINIALDDTSPSGLTFTPDGLRMYVVGNSTNNIIEYDLSVAFDVTTAVTTGAVYNMTELDGNPTDITFNANGSRMYIVGNTADAVFAFSLSTEYDLSTAAYTGESFSVGTEDISPTDLEFNSDGSKLFVIGNTNDAVYEYDLSINYDITTAVFSQSLSIIGQEATGMAIAFNGDGSRLLVLGSSSDRIYEYHLATGFDLSTAIYSGISTPSIFETSPEGLALSPDGTKMFTTGPSNDNVHSYNLSNAAFYETAANDGTLEGSMVIGLQSAGFLPGTTLTNGTHYTVDNIPTGLTPNVLVASDGLSAVLTFLGLATNNDNADDLTDIQMTFTDAAFTGGILASGVLNAVGGSSGLAIDFTGNPLPTVEYTSPVHVATAVVGAQFGVGTEETASSGIEFSPDGLKMFITGNADNDVTEYDLIVPYDVTTASFSGVTYDISPLDGTPTDVGFNATGSRMYVSGLDFDNIHEFILTTEYDLSTAIYTGNVLYVGAEDGQPGDFTFNRDGSRLFMAGSLNDSIYQYDLSVNYDITSATYLSAFHVGLQETNVLAMEFNTDGSRMFILGSGTDNVYEYHLTTAFDISTASYSGISFSTGTEESAPEGMTLSSDGTQLFTVGVNSDMVTEYAMSRIVFRETGANDGTLEGNMIIGVTSEVFANPGGALADGTDYSVDNGPVGLTPTIAVSSDGLSAKLSFTGSAINNDDVDDIADIQMSFTNTAFTGGTPAASVTNAVGGSSGLEINFTPNPAPAIQYQTYSDLTTAVFNNTFDASAQGTNHTGMVFNTDGSKMFTSSASNNSVNQYDLATNFDISTAVLGLAFNVQPIVGIPSDLAFNDDGSRLFVASFTNGFIYEYRLETPFDLATATYTGNSVSIGAEDLSITGIHFGNDGQSLFMAGDVNDAIFQYSLSIPYDISTLVYTGNSFSVQTETTSPGSIDFNVDGTQMIIEGIQVLAYDLTTPFDISTATFNSVSFDVATEESFLEAAVFADNDTRLVICGTFNGLFTSYNLTSQGNFIEAVANDGSVEGSMVVRVIGDQFTSPGTSLVDGTDYSVVNMPTGLTPVMDVAPDGTTALLTFTGNAVANNSADAVADISITFENTALVSANAAGVANAVAGSSGVGIDFDDNVNVVAFAASNITSSSFQANWTGGVDVQEYRIDISEQADFSTFFDGYQDFSVGLATNVVVTTADFGTDYYYRVRYTDNSSNVSTDSNVIMVTTTTDQGTLDDFAALTDIYNAMNGANWTVNTGWLSTRLQDWTLITLDANQRVTDVDLSNNNLSGALPDILVGLEQLIDLNLSSNAVEGLGDISNLTAMTDFNVSFNHLEFDDLEPIVPLGITNFTYNDQLSLQFDPETDPNFLKDVRGETVRIVPHTNGYSVSVTTLGANNQYNWLVDGNAISTGADYTITNGTVDITAINFDNMGQFSAEVTNTLLPNLTLFVDPENIFATADVAMTITDFSDNALADNLSGYLLEAFRRTSGFDTLERADDVGSSFIFSDVVLGDYLCSIDPSNRELFIPSYYGDVFEWDEADTLFLRADANLVVKVTGVPTEPLEGDGVLDVVIEEDFDATGGRIDARRRAAGRKCGLKKRRSGGRTGQEDVFDLIAYGETDENGEFQFGQLPEGVYRFFVEYPGIPLDESSFVEFEVGEEGVSDTEFKLTAFASEAGLEISIERVLGVILEYFKNLEIYPNPSDEFVNIRYRHLKSKDVTGQLVDLAGNTLWSQDLQSGFDGKIKIDVTGFEEGIYLLHFYDRTSRDVNVVTYRIIVSK